MNRLIFFLILLAGISVNAQDSKLIVRVVVSVQEALIVQPVKIVRPVSIALKRVEAVVYVKLKPKQKLKKAARLQVITIKHQHRMEQMRL